MNLTWFVYIGLILAQIRVVNCIGFVDVRFVNFSDPKGVLHTGNPCMDGICNIIVAGCISNETIDGNCKRGIKFFTKTYQTKGNITFEDVHYEYTWEKWSGHISIYLNILDFRGTESNPIDKHTKTFNLDVSKRSSIIKHHITLRGKVSTINLIVTNQCSDGYYGSSCKIYCKEGQGHYNCSKDGKKICDPGWEGKDCNKTMTVKTLLDTTQITTGSVTLSTTYGLYFTSELPYRSSLLSLYIHNSTLFPFSATQHVRSSLVCTNLSTYTLTSTHSLNSSYSLTSIYSITSTYLFTSTYTLTSAYSPTSTYLLTSTYVHSSKSPSSSNKTSFFTTRASTFSKPKLLSTTSVFAVNSTTIIALTKTPVLPTLSEITTAYYVHSSVVGVNGSSLVEARSGRWFTSTVGGITTICLIIFLCLAVIVLFVWLHLNDKKNRKVGDLENLAKKDEEKQKSNENVVQISSLSHVEIISIKNKSYKDDSIDVGEGSSTKEQETIYKNTYIT